MCRNIRKLYNFDPPASEAEVRAASLQFVRKISGFNEPSEANRRAFEDAVDQVTNGAIVLLGSLTTRAAPKNREVEAEKARVRIARRA